MQSSLKRKYRGNILNRVGYCRAEKLTKDLVNTLYIICILSFLNLCDTVVMADPSDCITLEILKEARETVRTSPLGVINTPMIPWSQTTLPLNVPCNIHIKMENMQRTGW